MDKSFAAVSGALSQQMLDRKRRVLTVLTSRWLVSGHKVAVSKAAVAGSESY